MAPFPETEIMTIKRLEVALRKADYKLLKDGAYKLHEKYHSGHRFEYLELLREILVEIVNNSSIPIDVKDILAPTIEDILTSHGMEANIASSPYESMNKNQVSSISSISYEAEENAQNADSTPKINAFSAFGANGRNNQAQENYQPKTFTQSPFSAQPFKEFSSTPQAQVRTIIPTAQAINVQQENTISQENTSLQQESVIATQESSKVEEVQVASSENFENNSTIVNNIEMAQAETPTMFQEEENKQETRTTAIFYNQQTSFEKIKNILKLRNLISNLSSGEVLINDVLSLISELNLQVNSNVSALKNLLNQLKNRENKVNLVTNCQSSNFTEVFGQEGFSYSLFSCDENKDISLFPYFGLSNYFLCSECGYEHLFAQENYPLIAQCPKCKKAMFPNYYINDGFNSEINIEYYNNSLSALVNSKVWLLIYPSVEDKFCIGLLKNALKLSKETKNIFILDKDINVREFYRNMFMEIDDKVNINAQVSVLEDFLNSIK